jgi:hypothetical protein
MQKASVEHICTCIYIAELARSHLTEDDIACTWRLIEDSINVIQTTRFISLSIGYLRLYVRVPYTLTFKILI